MFNPIYKKKQLILANRASSKAIVSLWSHRDNIVKELDRDSFAALGQLYSATRGLDPLVRNLLANPIITTLILYGRDLSGSGKALSDFFNFGVAMHTTPHGVECWKVKSSVDGFIDKEVTLEAIDLLRKTINFVSCSSIEELKEELKKEDTREERKESFVFTKKDTLLDFFPAEETSFTVRGKTIAETWLKILNTVMRFGTTTETHYDSRQKEILNLTSVVTAENVSMPYLPSFLPCDKQELENYIPRVLTDKKYPDCSYTYGQRLRSFFDVDQIQAIVDRLSKDIDSRSGAASLWDSRKDGLKKSGTPCLNHIWVRVRENKIFMTAVIRSNDMFSAWPENAFALLSLQDLIRKSIEEKINSELVMGDLVTLSESAHVYEDCWDSCKEILVNNLEKETGKEKVDPRGHFSIEVDCGNIVVEHITKEGEFLRRLKGTSMKKIQAKLVRNSMVSSLDHSLYLGGELAKAELALNNPALFTYIQDRPLIFK